MRFSLQIFTLVSIWTTRVYSDTLGPRFPPPIHFANNDSLIAAGWKNVTSVFDAYLQGDLESTPKQLAGLENLTFSIGMFSIHDPAAQSLQYHYTSEEVKNGPGTHNVDGDSIYRVASITKVFSVLAGLLEFDDEQWERPITDFVSGLSKSTLDKVGDDRIRNTKWEHVTLRALAAHVGGVPREIGVLESDLLLAPHPEALGLPPRDPNDVTSLWPCTAVTDIDACTPELFFEGIMNSTPSLQPWTTSLYSNDGFILFGLALANITGKPIAQVYPDVIFNPLGLTNSKSAPPPEPEWPQYVIPGDATGWSQPQGPTTSSGGLFSSINDLAVFGTALLNSTLLSPEKTREWMKPVSHTGSLTFAVGAPWEIYRYTHATTGAVTDIYTKSGDSGNFTGFAVLLPDYDAGFNVLTGGSLAQKAKVAFTIADVITTTILPALEAQAAADAKHNFAGTYVSKDPALNSSLTVSFNESSVYPGLYITSWISNSTDLTPLLPDLLGGPAVRLQPSIKEPGQVGFRALPPVKSAPSVGPFWEMYSERDNWIYFDVYASYGGVPLSLFVFDVDADGKATAASPVATKAKLERVKYA
jgi:CubicO group peptidase (beta-lactamase class C family)